MVYFIMENKGFDARLSEEKTPTSLGDIVDKPVKVDINVLKARAQHQQDKENRRNISIFICFLLMLGAVGLYLSI